MQQCERCQGFVPGEQCPNCATEGRFGRLLVKLAKWAGPGIIATTLMACYGAPPPSYRAQDRYPYQGSPCAPGSDTDGDRQCAPADCNDSDPYMNPSAQDPLGDGIDSNCDGVDGQRDTLTAPVGMVPPG